MTNGVSIVENNNRNLFINKFGTYREYMFNFGVFCNMSQCYVIISFFFTIKLHLILKDSINSCLKESERQAIGEG